ncbi:MAG: Signal peptidase-like protein [Rhodothermia bacterium]|nr:Signal peptidase-like protein [Rhodothermia bacterium]
MACGSCGTGGCETGGCSSGGCGVKKEAGSCPSMFAHDWLNVVDLERPGTEFGVYEVLFKAGRRGFYANNNNLDLSIGDPVLVEADRGVDYGTINLTGEMVRLRLKSKKTDPTTAFPAIIRTATLEDIEHAEKRAERESASFTMCRELIDKHELTMRLVDVEWQFDGNKVTFFFTSDKRVDFRKLVRDLAARLSTRIELRQIGARDAAARVGGLGSCGRELCCSTWLQEFKPVSTTAAKFQSLPLNLTRLSGQCGRLKCCLNYELEQYIEALNEYPDIGISFNSPNGRAYITKLDIFKQLVWFELQDGSFDAMPLTEIRKILRMDTPEGHARAKRRVFGQGGQEEEELRKLED